MIKKEVNKTPWFIIETAVAISILVCMITTLIYRENFEWLTAFVLFFNICWEIIPYWILIVLWKRIEKQKSISKKYGIRGAFVLLILSQTFWEIIHWISAYTPPHDTTFTIASFVFLSGFVGGIGYGIGYLIGYFRENTSGK